MTSRNFPLGRVLGAALAAGALVQAAPAQVAAPGGQTANAAAPVFQVAVGRGRLVTLSHPMSDLFIADPSIADVQVRSPTQLYVFGKKTGETSVSATGRNGAVVWQATVRAGNNYDTINQMLTLAMPEARIEATTMNGLVLLTGTVANPDDAAEAEKLVQAFVGEGTKVLSRLKTATPLQVNLQVRFAEVNRSFVKNVGVNFSTVDATSGFKFGLSRGRSSGPQFAPGGALGVGFANAPYNGSLVSQLASGSTLGLAGHLLGLDLLSAIDLGETTGQVTTLANPNLTALSGETGTFLAGGEIPIPIAQGLGTVSVDYKQYGISLTYTPVVMSDGRISLRVKPEVSQLDYSNAVSLNGTRVPGITTRRAETTVELGSGQSFMIGGLLSNMHNNSFEKTPGIGDVPVLGALFRSNAFQRNETELVIVITPYLVKPVNANDIALPTDGYRAPTDAGRILLEQFDRSTTGGSRPKPSMAPPAAPVQPALGAASPVPAAPAPMAAAAADRRATEPKKGKKGQAPAPGFSSN